MLTHCITKDTSTWPAGSGSCQGSQLPSHGGPKILGRSKVQCPQNVTVYTAESLAAKPFFGKFQELILLGNGRQKKSPSAADWEHWMKHVRMVMMVMPIPYNWRGTFGTDWISARTVTAYLTSGWKESNLESSFGLQNLWCNSGCFNSWSSISAKSPQKKNTKAIWANPKHPKSNLETMKLHGVVWPGTEDRRTLFQALANMPATEATTCPGHKFWGYVRTRRWKVTLSVRQRYIRRKV